MPPSTMTRKLAVLAAVLAAAAALLAPPAQASEGFKCVGCTIALGLLEQRALATGLPPHQVMSDFCGNATNPVGKIVCNLADGYLVKAGLDRIKADTAPEVACQKLGLCPAAPQCVLFPQWPPASGRASPALARRATATAAAAAARGARPQVAGEVGFWDTIKDVLGLLKGNLTANVDRVFDLHAPMKADDADADRFAASASGLRGTSWRGVDCDDTRADVYPGRLTSAYDASVDHNCNGVVGSLPNGTSYEDAYCSGEYAPRSLIAIGDSATAHFGIPEPILSPDGFFNDSTWAGMLHFAANEADWPECSWSTGFEQDAAGACPPVYHVPDEVVSVYTQMKRRNRCMANDRQNLGVNGARTTNTEPPNGDIMALRRDQQNDRPALVFFELIGNDVCNGHPGTGHMTTPEVFEAAVLRSLDYLDTQLAPGSSVVFGPLADGELLYQVLHNRTHPIGVPYPVFYDYLACIGHSPCRGWMSSNATLRAATQARANELSAVYPKIVAARKYKNFEMAVLPSGLMRKLVEQFEREGLDPAHLITRTDGFHPSATAQTLIAQETFQWLEVNHPSFLGPVNPHNDVLVAKFGEYVEPK